MTTVAVVCIATLACVAVLAFARLLDKQHRQHARERELLLNQIMHLTGRTWTPPPADQWQPPDEAPDEYGRYVTSSSQTVEDF